MHTPIIASILTHYLAQYPTTFPYATLFRSHHLDKLISVLESDKDVELEIIKHVQLGKLRYEKLLINLGVNTMTALSQNTDRKSARLNSSHVASSYRGFCLQNKTYQLDEM